MPSDRTEVASASAWSCWWTSRVTYCGLEVSSRMMIRRERMHIDRQFLLVVRHVQESAKSIKRGHDWYSRGKRWDEERKYSCDTLRIRAEKMSGLWLMQYKQLNTAISTVDRRALISHCTNAQSPVESIYKRCRDTPWRSVLRSTACQCQPIARGQPDTIPYVTNVKALARGRYRPATANCITDYCL